MAKVRRTGTTPEIEVGHVLRTLGQDTGAM